MKLQDGLVYDEPPDWYYPTRESLGLELLAMGKTGEAEAVYREDLKLNPGNPRSLYGLAMALRTQGRLGEAAMIEKQFSNAWRYADAQTPTVGSALVAAH